MPDNLRISFVQVGLTCATVSLKCHIALIEHNNCGMVNLHERKELFIQGLIDIAGWSREHAEEHFMTFAPKYEIGNEIEFILSETKRLRLQYPKI